jgi:ATP-dependent RNA helicase RhlB
MKNAINTLDSRIASVLSATGGAALEAHADSLAEALLSLRRNVSAGVRLGNGVVPVLGAVAAQWLARDDSGRVLVICPDERDLALMHERLSPFCDALGLHAAITARQADAEADSAALLIGALDTLRHRQEDDSLPLDGFSLLLIPDLDALSTEEKKPSLNALFAALPPWPERKAVVLSANFGVEERALARALAPEPVELMLEEREERVKALTQSTWYVSQADKAKLVLGLLKRDEARPVALFCNLRDGAEDAAARLRANGIKVDYIIGNLPQKKALLDAVRAGDIEVLVLTDQGAEGLAKGWAKRLINWDLPLEGEFYGERLLCLDGDEDSRSWNLACDRYVYGIPAIESYLGYGLDARQVDEALFAAVDKSEGMRFDRRPPGNGERQKQRGNEGRRDGPRREGNEERRDDGGRYDGRNAHAIQADIAAITGGRAGPGPDRGPAGEQAAHQPRNQQRQQPKARTESGRGGPSKRRGAAQQNRDGRKQGQPSGGARGQNSRAPAKRESAALPENPYALPMEERMRLYRERYGSQSRQGSGHQGRPAGQRASSGPRGSGAPREGSPRGKQAGRDTSGRAQERPAPQPSSPVAPAPAVPEDGGKGIMGALKDMFKKK